MEPVRSAKHSVYAVAGLLVLSAASFFLGLNRVGFIGPDEPRYAEVAREMFVSGDYITPHLCGCLWFEKPALLYWMAAVAYRMFGIGEFAARAPSAVCATIAVISLFYAVSRRVSFRLALIASITLSTTALFVGYARASVTDMPLAAAMCIALISFFLAATTAGRIRTCYWAIGGAATGAAVLAKGLVGLVLIVAIVALTYVLSRRPVLTGWRECAAGVAIFLIVVSVWYLPVTVEHGREFIEEFFINQHFKRYLKNRYQHPQPFYFFPFVMLAGALPWTFFLVPAIARLRRLKLRSSDTRDYLLLLAWAWVAVPLLFFSFSWSKLPGYILPVFPALAVILAVEVERVWRGERAAVLIASKWMTAGLLLLMGSGFPVYLKVEGIPTSGIRSAAAWAPLAGALVAGGVLAAGRFRGFLVASGGFAVGMIICSVVLLLPHFNDTLSSKGLSLQAAASLRAGEKIAFFLNKEYGPVFYAEGRVVCGTGYGDVLNAFGADEIERVLETEKSLIVITTTSWENDLVRNERLHTQLIGRQGNDSAFRVMLRSRMISAGSGKEAAQP